MSIGRQQLKCIQWREFTYGSSGWYTNTSKPGAWEMTNEIRKKTNGNWNGYNKLDVEMCVTPIQNFVQTAMQMISMEPVAHIALPTIHHH